MGTVDDLLLAGWHFKQTGQHAQAELAYRHAVEVDAERSEAWASLGTFCLQRGRLDEAIDHFRRALQLRPDDSIVHSNLGIALAGAGRAAEALASFAEAVRLDPNRVDAQANLGNALREAGRLDEAVACLRAALALQPGHGPAQLNLGTALMHLRRLDEAVAHLQQATHLAPNDPLAQHALGLAYAEQEQFAAAADCFERARRLRPDFVNAHADLGVALGRLGKPTAALAALREAERLQSPSPEILNGIGAAMGELGDYAGSLGPLEAALRLRPDFVAALVNRGDALRCCGRTDEALASLQRALELDPTAYDAHHNLALVYADLGRTTEALAEFDAALASKPDFPLCRKNRALVWLRLGDWVEGWSEFEWRWHCRELPPRRCDQPRWDGTDLTGKTILLWAEQGLGDTLQFVRYAKLVKERGATVLLECPSNLHPLLSHCAGIDRLLSGPGETPSFDVHAPLMSLPGLLGSTPDRVPASIPYLHAEPSLVERWRSTLAPVAGFRVGICWQGNAKFMANRFRSFPLQALAPLAQVPGVRLVSLQKGPGAHELAELDGRFEVVDPAEPSTPAQGAFVDAAAIIANLDLVVSCDTAIGHLAGALGKPVWLALAFAADWRWLLNRSDTPWYPTMRLFRQSAPGDWASVFNAMAAALAQRSGERRASAC